MFRTVLSLVAVAVVFAHTASAAQTSAPQPPAKSSSRSAAVVAPASAPININTASAAELDGLPGIGAKTAARIVEYRQKNGPFKKIEELMNVRGVGEKNFLKLKDRIIVAAAKSGV
ncbi:MAG TPA: helix-hairpin-helix domain-containing protein [Vicinamibacterales bacterium]|nr:helix-hairpin-helix domain-containing protein [Vicinamibacterales bacterium]